MNKMPKYLQDAIPNFIGGLAVAIILALGQWISTQYASAGIMLFIQVGIMILWVLWLIWMGFVILWVYNRYQQSHTNHSMSSSPPTTQDNRAAQPEEKEQASQYHSCFISYSHKDENFARRLHDDLEKAGVQCWFAPEDMKIGDKIRQAIENSIHAHSKLLLILSQNSIKSDWVEGETETVFEIERNHENTLVLFPIRLDDEVMETQEAWAAYIRRTRHIGNFSLWQDEAAYQRALQRLLRDLKIE